MSVLIIADREDIHADCIVTKVRQLGHEVVRISPAEDFSKNFLLDSYNITSVEIGGKSVRIDEVTGVMSRIAAERFNECFLPRNAIEKYSIEEEAVAWLSALLLVPFKNWMNSPQFELWADVKPSSLIKATQVGLSVPDFIISNSFSRALSFCQNSLAVIKPLSDASFAFQSSEYVSIPDFGDFDAPGTRIFQPEGVESDFLDGTPFLLQRYIKRTEEYRVTVVDSRAFVALAELSSERIDIKEVDFAIYTASKLPARDEALLIELSISLGLRICTFDILRSQSNELFLVDINPGGNWLWLDREFGGAISTSIAESLTQPGGFVAQIA